MKTDPQLLGMLAESYAFIGNSLLKPMNQSSDVGLDPSFWGAFSAFEAPVVSSAVDALRSFAEACGDRAKGVEGVSVEFTRLFIGPPRPAAAPWESYYTGEDDVHSGFGAATFRMKRLLAQSGLEVANENNQLADHMGIELLLLSVLCERAAGGECPLDVAAYVEERPLSWIAELQERVTAAAPQGYHARLLALAEALMRYQLEDWAPLPS